MRAPDSTRPVIGWLALVICWAVVTVSWPLPGDAQVFAWLADTAVRGEVPYRDAFDTKGPMAWLPIVWIRQVGPVGHASALRLVETVCVLAGLGSVHAILHRLGAPRSGWAGALLLFGWWQGLGFWDTLQPDGWAGAWLALACALALGTHAAGGFGAGLLVALATAVKPTYAAFLLPVVLVARQRNTTVRAIGLPALGMVLGGALVALAVARHGALSWLVEAWRWTASTYTGDKPGLVTLAGMLLEGLSSRPWGLALPFAAAGLVHRWQRGDRWVAAGLAVWLGGALATVAVQARFWPYHWLPVLAPLATCTGLGLSALFGKVEGTVDRMMRRAVLVPLVGIALLSVARHAQRWLGSLRSPDAARTYQQREFGSYGNQPGSVLAIADSVVRGTSPDEPLLVWGFYPGVPTLVGHRSASRYAIMIPLFVGDSAGVRARIRTEFMRELAAHPPRWWLFPGPTMRDRPQETDAWAIERFPEARAFRDSAYAPPRATGDWLVYELRRR